MPHKEVRWEYGEREADEMQRERGNQVIEVEALNEDRQINAEAISFNLFLKD